MSMMTKKHIAFSAFSVNWIGKYLIYNKLTSNQL